MTLPVQASITSVPVGEELYLRCRENFVMDSKVSPVVELSTGPRDISQ